MWWSPFHGTRSRIAGALAIRLHLSYHIIFPSFTIGLAAYLATFRGKVREHAAYH